MTMLTKLLWKNSLTQDKEKMSIKHLFSTSHLQRLYKKIKIAYIQTFFTPILQVWYWANCRTAMGAYSQKMTLANDTIFLNQLIQIRDAHHRTALG